METEFLAMGLNYDLNRESLEKRKPVFWLNSLLKKTKVNGQIREFRIQQLQQLSQQL